MRKAFVLLVLMALVAGAFSTAASAKPPPRRAELVAKGPTATYANGKLDVAVAVKNKGNKKAKKSQTGFFLSMDGTKSADDADLGSLTTPKLKPKKKKTVSGSLSLPVGLLPGSYRLVTCADITSVVRERKEQNNCKASRSSVTVPGGPPPPGKVTVSATATAGGTIAASAVTGGSCVGTFCTLTSGAGTVTFTPTTAAGYRFGGWSGCTGFTGTTAITFTNPTESKACTATFVRQVTISWTVTPVQLTLINTVTGSASNGTCTADAISGGGSCLVDAGVGTVALTAATNVPLVWEFDGWSNGASGACDGVPSGATMTFTSPNAAKSCVATFSLLGPL